MDSALQELMWMTSGFTISQSRLKLQVETIISQRNLLAVSPEPLTLPYQPVEEQEICKPMGLGQYC